VIVDAHQHLWDPAVRDYPWMAGERAALRRRRGWEDLAELARAAGVDATVAVQAAMSEDETRELLAAADEPRSPVGAPSRHPRPPVPRAGQPLSPRRPETLARVTVDRDRVSPGPDRRN